MDQHTSDLLEFGKIRDQVASYATSSLGRELARNMGPLGHAAALDKELDLVSEMVAALDSGLAPPLGGLRDVHLMVRRAGIGTMLSADQLLEVAECLNCTGAVYRYRSRLNESHPTLIELLSQVEDLGMVAKSIGGCIDGRGYVLDLASRELSAIRQKLFVIEESVKAEIRRLLRDPELRKILSYSNATVNGDHYVLPVAINHRHKVAGVTHRVSSTGETAFVEPASVSHLSSDRIALKAEEDREVKKILRRLSAEVGRVSKPLIHSLDIIARLDLIAAKASYSRDYAMSRPEVNGDRRFWLRSARHPILEQLFRENASAAARPQVVPVDLVLGVGYDLLIITGPNTGGKTVVLKTAGLLAWMALCGLHIPAAPGSSVPRFERILADIGDEQSLQQSLSTFSSHVSRIAAIFETANANSLILLDEVGSGTDPTDGAALGRAILDHLKSTGGLAAVTTHLGDLKSYALENDGAENAAVEFDFGTLRPTYRLMVGQTGQSNAIEIAKRLRLPESLVRRAESYLQSPGSQSAGIEQLQAAREQAEAARKESLAARYEAEAMKADYLRRVAELGRQADAEQTLLGVRLSLVPNMNVRVSRFEKVGKVVRVDAKKQTAVVSVGLGQWEIPFDEIFPVD